MPSRANRKRKARDVRHLNEPQFVAPAGMCPLTAYVNFNHEMHRQTTADYNKKDELRCWVEDCLHQAGYDEYSCYMVGSTSNGFGTKNSDVDICLVIDHNTEIVNKTESMRALKACRKAMRQVGRFQDFSELIPAKVPILRLNLRGVQIDINCNNLTGLRNTWLLNAYSASGNQINDPRVKPLAMFIKKICKKLTINNASEGTLTSYSINLMLINYLQTRSPPILPVLQVLDEEINISEGLENLPRRIRQVPEKWEIKNTATVGQLAFGFFDYYNQFDFNQVISTRLGQPVKASDGRLMFPDNQLFTDKKIRIEEPFDGTNTARAVYKPESFPKIKFAIQTAQQLLERCLNGGEEIQELISELYLDKQELETIITQEALVSILQGSDSEGDQKLREEVPSTSSSSPPATQAKTKNRGKTQAQKDRAKRKKQRKIERNRQSKLQKIKGHVQQQKHVAKKVMGTLGRLLGITKDL